MYKRQWCSLAVFVTALSGCFLLPRGYEEQRARSQRALEPYLQVVRQQPWPSVEEEADWNTLVELAWRRNGEVEAALAEWLSAIERVRDAAGYPNTNLHLAAEAMWSGRDLGWNGVTVSATNDPMTNLALPVKVAQAARVALEEARAAEARFHARRLAVREQVAGTFFSWVAAQRKAELARERAAWLARMEDSTRAALSAGGSSQWDWLETRNARMTAENEAANSAAQAEALQRQLNGLLGRDPEAHLRPPAEMPAASHSSYDLQELQRILQTDNPELAALRAEMAAREQALALTRLQFLPDINPMAAVTGEAVSQAAGLAFVLPLTWRKIQAQVAAANALVQASRALLRQGESDRQAMLAATLVVLDNLDRQRTLWSEELLPNWRLRCRALQRAYESGSEPLQSWAQAEVMGLEAEAMLAELTALREEQRVKLETLLGQGDVLWTGGRAGGAS